MQELMFLIKTNGSSNYFNKTKKKSFEHFFYTNWVMKDFM